MTTQTQAAVPAAPKEAYLVKGIDFIMGRQGSRIADSYTIEDVEGNPLCIHKGSQEHFPTKKGATEMAVSLGYRIKGIKQPGRDRMALAREMAETTT